MQSGYFRGLYKRADTYSVSYFLMQVIYFDIISTYVWKSEKFCDEEDA